MGDGTRYWKGYKLSKECKNEPWAACKNQIDEALSYLHGVKAAMRTLGMHECADAITDVNTTILRAVQNMQEIYDEMIDSRYKQAVQGSVNVLNAVLAGAGAQKKLLERGKKVKVPRPKGTGI